MSLHRIALALIVAFAGIGLIENGSAVFADETAESADHGHGGHGDHDGPDMSKPPLHFEKDLALWSGVSFILFVLVMRVFAWRPIMDGLEKRETGIQQDIADAHDARIKAEKMLADHEEKLSQVQAEVQEIIAEARRDADRTKQDILTQAQKDAEATKNRSIEEIERARDAALKDLFDVMTAQIAGATEHVLSRSVTGDDQNRLIEEALSQFNEQSS